MKFRNQKLSEEAQKVSKKLKFHQEGHKSENDTNSQKEENSKEQDYGFGRHN
jgi:hypothetical protein